VKEKQLPEGMYWRKYRKTPEKITPRTNYLGIQPEKTNSS
jgi:hypothetical protein